MDAAEFNAIADRYGAPPEERAHVLDNARWDLEHRPETVHGRDVHRIAADAVAASRAPGRPKLEEVKFPRSSWTPAGVKWPAGWDEPPRDEMLEWWERHVAAQKAATRF